MSEKIPPIIWIYWDKGFEQAPDVVNECVNSWQTLNPDYRVILLNSGNVAEFLGSSLDPIRWEMLPIQQAADLIRLQLLCIHGGIWVDATLFCTLPLRSWLRRDHPSGFYIVDVPESSDKLFDNFFIASRPGGIFVKTWLRMYRNYLKTIPQQMTHQMMKRMLKRFPFMRAKLGRILFTFRPLKSRFGSPYFAVQYLGTRSLLTHPFSLYCWIRRHKTQALKFSRIFSDPSVHTRVEDELRGGKYPFMKLTHKPLPDQLLPLARILAALKGWQGKLS